MSLISSRATRALVLVAVCLLWPGALHCQKRAASRDRIRDSTLATGITAGEADGERPRRQLIKALDLDLGFTTLRIGAGLLVDYTMFDQDSASRDQFRLVSIGKLRDFRFLLGGRFKGSKRPFTWQAGIMWDAATMTWLVRQTGLMIAVPEIWSHFFIGRAKEGFSLNKVMVGYDGWAEERMPFTDATVPLLADGIKWLGYVPNAHWFWNLGFFGDAFSEGQTFSSYDNQFVARVGWVPQASDSTGTVFHLAMNFRTGTANNDSLRLRSRPEDFEAPYFLDTGTFPANGSTMFGPELYYRPGRLLLGAENYWQKVRSPQTGNPWFYGGQFIATWNVTGETRSYNTVGNYFRTISPDSTVIQGGPGAWEVVLTYSYTNLTNGPVQGGTFWRVTPMLNWYLTDNVRLEFVYGFGKLDRFGITGATQFFQSRIQLRL